MLRATSVRIRTKSVAIDPVFVVLHCQTKETGGFFPRGATAPSGPGPPNYRGFTITDTSRSVGLLWTSHQPDAEIST
jgi:hypothetical protein